MLGCVKSMTESRLSIMSVGGYCQDQKQIIGLAKASLTQLCWCINADVLP